MDINAYYKNTRHHSWISVKNELDCIGRSYPDMDLAYINFSEQFDIPIGNFILTNGCESALRISLLATKIKYLLLENPTWQLANIMANAIDIKTTNLSYHYDTRFYIDSPPKEGPVYHTDKFNNLFGHDMITDYRDLIILDETYTNGTLFNSDRIIPENRIVIGSFSKSSSAAMRLGYCIFSNTWYDRFYSLRDRYISREACSWLNTPSFVSQPLWNWDIPYNIVSQHPVYTTVIAKTLPIPHKKFTVDGIDFCRFGNVMNSWKKEYIEWKLNTFFE